MKAIQAMEKVCGDIGKAIQRYAHINGYSVVERILWSWYWNDHA